MKVTINVSWFNESTRTKESVSVDVRKRAKLNGHDIYIDAEGWYYVECRGVWHYFGTLREANRFIRDTYWG